MRISGARGGVRVEPLDAETRPVVRKLLGAEFDLGAFYAWARRDRTLARLTQELAGLRPPHFLRPRQTRIPVWHLIGGLDPLEPEDLTGSEPDDGYPVLLEEWIKRDGLACLKVKLRGTDGAWDYERMVRIGRIGFANGVRWLSAEAMMFGLGMSPYTF